MTDESSEAQAAGGAAEQSDRDVYLPREPRRVQLPRVLWLGVGLLMFAGFALAPPFPDAIDPAGEAFRLSAEGRMALGLFFLAAIWWVFEVLPIGVTAIAIGVFQALFLIRDPRTAFTDFMDPSVWFIIGSVVIGMAFSKTGLTNRLAYLMLSIVGDSTRRIYLGCFLMTAGLTLLMAHTAVAAAVLPLLMAIHALYDDEERQTRFGRGLFIGMAFTAGAGSIITLFGAPRSAVGIGFYNELIGREISFFELTYYMLPLGAFMVILLWLYVCLVFPPERRAIAGLRERARGLYRRLGPLSLDEILALVITLGAIGVMSLRSVVPALAAVDKSAIILSTTLLFFIVGILKLEDLEAIPWNIVLLFGGAMSIGFCLWETGAAQWLAIQWLGFFADAPWLAFVMGFTFFVLVMTNVIMNVAAIAISLPVALVMAPYLGFPPEIVFFPALATAGMPFLFLVGAAPNAIAYQSRQFSAWTFLLAGAPASVLLLLVITLFVWKIWPAMGMPTVAG